MCMRQRSRRKENLEWNCIIGLCLVSYLVFGLWFQLCLLSEYCQRSWSDSTLFVEFRRYGPYRLLLILLLPFSRGFIINKHVGLPCKSVGVTLFVYLHLSFLVNEGIHAFCQNSLFLFFVIKRTFPDSTVAEVWFAFAVTWNCVPSTCMFASSVCTLKGHCSWCVTEKYAFPFKVTFLFFYRMPSGHTVRPNSLPA